jgi:hypothetical protein
MELRLGHPVNSPDVFEAAASEITAQRLYKCDDEAGFIPCLRQRFCFNTIRIATYSRGATTLLKVRKT